jgi:hypothetical protein
MIEMSEAYTPEISDYKTASIVDVQKLGRSRKMVTLKLESSTSGTVQPKDGWGPKIKSLYQETKGKLDIPAEEDEEGDGIELNTDQIITEDWDTFVEPRLISKF